MSASRWIGARVRWASPTIRTIWASIVSAPTRSARITRPPGAVDGAADEPVRRAFLDGDRLAGDHRFVDEARALDDHAVDRDLLSRPDPEPVADVDLVEGDVLLAAVVLQSPRDLRREAQQGLDRARRLVPGAELEHLPQEHQRRDHRRRLEVDRDRAVVAAERGRKEPGEEVGDDAVEVGGAGADGDQREHVEAATERSTPSPGRRTATRPRGRPGSPARARPRAGRAGG